jgi:tripartite-type tricarboxylate transporter receptor subunit TctC
MNLRVSHGTAPTRRDCLALLAACGLAKPAASVADTWPSRPVRVIVPFAPGGSLDTVSRAVSERLSVRLNATFTVDNRAGGSGVIGYEMGARAAPDGYTLVGASDSLTLLPHLGRKLSFDPLRDFTPIIQLAAQPHTITVHPGLGVNSFAELVAAARKRPGEITYASSGVGTSQNLAGELINKRFDIQLRHIPYRGGGQAINDLLSGQVKVGVLGLPPVVPHHREGRLRIVAFTTARRFSLMPEIPTVAENGGGDFDIEQWSSWLGPVGLPAAIVNRLETEITSIISSGEIRAVLGNASLAATGVGSGAFAELIRKESTEYARLARELGVKLE